MANSCRAESVGGSNMGYLAATIIQEEAFESLDAPVRIIGALDTPVPYSPPLEEFFLPGEPEIERAAQHAYAHDFIRALPAGYDTIAGDEHMNDAASRGRLKPGHGCLAESLSPERRKRAVSGTGDGVFIDSCAGRKVARDEIEAGILRNAGDNHAAHVRHVSQRAEVRRLSNAFDRYWDLFTHVKQENQGRLMDQLPPDLAAAINHLQAQTEVVYDAIKVSIRDEVTRAAEAGQKAEQFAWAAGLATLALGAIVAIVVLAYTLFVLSFKQAFADVQMRINALALVHRHLYESQDMQEVDLHPFMTNLCSLLQDGSGVPPRRVRLSVDIPKVKVTGDRMSVVIPSHPRLSRSCSIACRISNVGWNGLSAIVPT